MFYHQGVRLVRSNISCWPHVCVWIDVFLSLEAVGGLHLKGTNLAGSNWCMFLSVWIHEGQSVLKSSAQYWSRGIAAWLYLARKREERSSVAFIICGAPFSKCQLVHWYFGFAPREPIDFRMKSTSDRMNTNDTTYFKCIYSLDTSTRIFTVTQGGECFSLLCFERRFHGMSVAAIPCIKKRYGLLRYIVIVCATGAAKIYMVVMSRIVYPLLYICPNSTEYNVRIWVVQREKGYQHFVFFSEIFYNGLTFAFLCDEKSYAEINSQPVRWVTQNQPRIVITFDLKTISWNVIRILVHYLVVFAGTASNMLPSAFFFRVLSLWINILQF